MSYFGFILMFATYNPSYKKALYVEHDTEVTRADIGSVKKNVLITGQKEPADNKKKKKR